MCFCSLLWSWQKHVNWRLRIIFVSRRDTPTRTIATWARHLSVFVCLVIVAELWECLTWLRGRSSELRTTSWTLTQVGFEGYSTFRTGRAQSPLSCPFPSISITIAVAGSTTGLVLLQVIFMVWEVVLIISTLWYLCIEFFRWRASSFGCMIQQQYAFCAWVTS